MSDESTESTETPRKRIFVFGSNLAGIHGAGSAKFASQKYGAQFGVGHGPTGDAYAIPTKDNGLRTMTISRIFPYIVEFIAYAKAHPELDFELCRIGCGLAGYTDAQMAPLFVTAKRLPNVSFPSEWENL